jgi:hypothetical protein
MVPPSERTLDSISGLEDAKIGAGLHYRLKDLGTDLGPWDFKTVSKHYRAFKTT